LLFIPERLSYSKLVNPSNSTRQNFIVGYEYGQRISDLGLRLRTSSTGVIPPGFRHYQFWDAPILRAEIVRVDGDTEA